MRIIR